jgi:hypothetical protein
VLVRYTPRELQLQVNDDRSAGDSDRLAGLRERVGLYAATCAPVSTTAAASA